MTRQEWFFWGYVLWLTFGVAGAAIALTPVRMGIVEPSWAWAIGGFIGGLVVFAFLELRRSRAKTP